MLLVVTPTRSHLGELVRAGVLLSVDDRKEDRVREALDGFFDMTEQTTLAQPLELGHDAVEALVAMGPSGWHRSPAEVSRRLAELADPVRVTASFTVSAYRPASGDGP